MSYTYEDIRKLNEIPRELLASVLGDINALYRLIDGTDKYAIKSNAVAAGFIADLKPGLKHLDMDCISYTDAFPGLIGLTLHEFSLLLKNLLPLLTSLLSNSPIKFWHHIRIHFSGALTPLLVIT